MNMFYCGFKNASALMIMRNKNVEETTMLEAKKRGLKYNRNNYGRHRRDRRLCHKTTHPGANTNRWWQRLATLHFVLTAPCCHKPPWIVVITIAFHVCIFKTCPVQHAMRILSINLLWTGELTRPSLHCQHEVSWRLSSCGKNVPMVLKKFHCLPKIP